MVDIEHEEFVDTVAEESRENGWNLDETTEEVEKTTEEVEETEEKAEEEVEESKEPEEEFEESKEEPEEETEESEEESEEEAEEESQEKAAETALQKRTREVKESRIAYEKEQADKKQVALQKTKRSLDTSSDFNSFVEQLNMTEKLYEDPTDPDKKLTYSEIKAEYPGSFKAQEDIMGALIGDFTRRFADQQESFTQQLTLLEVQQKHSDIRSLMVDDKFTNWLDSQGADAVRLFDFGTAEDVSIVVSDYKDSIKPVVKKEKAKPKAKAPARKKRSIRTAMKETGGGTRESGWGL